MVKKKKKLFGKIRKGIKYGLLAGLILHAGSQLAYLVNDAYHTIRPSTHRAKFEKQFGFPLKGWSEDIEENQQNVSIISEVIEKERRSKDFKLVSIRIRNENYLKQPSWDQIDYIIKTSPAQGSYIEDKIMLDDQVRGSTLHHECKHAKVYDIITEHPEFLEKWETLARDESGESLYLSEAERLGSRVWGLGFLVDEKNKIFSENKQLGFISNYARTNVHEDIAELCEEVEMNPESFSKLLFGSPESRNDVIAKKVALAQEYELIPEDFTEFVKLGILYKNSTGFHGHINQKKAQHFMRESAEFLNKNLNSIYEGKLRASRAYVLSQGIYSSEPTNNIEDAIREYMGVLTSEYKGDSAYASALFELSRIYEWILKDKKTSNIFLDAEIEYYERFESGVVDLPRNGVNDFLKSKGIRLEKKPLWPESSLFKTSLGY